MTFVWMSNQNTNSEIKSTVGHEQRIEKKHMSTSRAIAQENGFYNCDTGLSDDELIQL